MAKPGRLVFALILIIIVISSSSSHTITVAAARSPFNRARELATDCNSPRQGEVAGCGGGGGSGGSSRPRPGGSTPGSSRCKKGCCGKNKLGDCVCCK